MIAPHCELLLGESSVAVEAIPWQAGGLRLVAAVVLVEAIPWQAGGLRLMAAVVLVEAIPWQAGGLRLIPAIVLVEPTPCVVLLWTHSSGCSSAALSLGTTAGRPPLTTPCQHPSRPAHPSAPGVLDPRHRILCLFCVPSPSDHEHGGYI